jgi:soluble lytic murein transglycosylase-like protein
MVMLSILIPLVIAAAQTTTSAPDMATSMAAAAERQRLGVQQAMAPSLDRQRQSIRIQASGSVEQAPGASTFFTVPWPKQVSMPANVAADCPPLPNDQVEALIDESARNEDLKPELLREVMRRESAFRPCAVSTSGAQGLMQLMPATAQQFHVSDAFEPKQNVAAGAKFLKTLLARYGGDVSLALGAYNAGPGRVDEAGGVPPIAETQDYVAAILKAVLLR